MMQELLPLAVIHFVSVTLPGPDFAVVSKNAVLYGRRCGFFTAFGTTLGISLHLMYTLLGVTLLLRGTVIWIWVQYAGVAYLLYLAFQLLRGSRMPFQEASTLAEVSAEPQLAGADLKEKSTRLSSYFGLFWKEGTVWKSFIDGFLTNIFNVKAAVFFVSVFATIVSPQWTLNWQILTIFWVVIVTLSWFCFVAYSVTFPVVRAFLLKNERYFRVFVAVAISLFALQVLLNI